MWHRKTSTNPIKDARQETQQDQNNRGVGCKCTGSMATRMGVRQCLAAGQGRMFRNSLGPMKQYEDGTPYIEAPDDPWTGGQKFDSGKPRMDLLDSTALTELARVLTFGAQKYAAHNWRKGINYSRLTAAALRHIHAFNSGETLDPESGLHHIGHAMCCCMFLLGLKNRPELDDRYKEEATCWFSSFGRVLCCRRETYETRLRQLTLMGKLPSFSAP